ncbi:MAG: RNA polymerase sigma factor [Myxococcaceae bacterium]
MTSGPPGLIRGELEELYSRFAPAVFRRARVMLGRDADAWDVVQEVFERMLNSAGEFRGEARPMTWLYRITTNLCLNHLRSRTLREPALAVISGEPSIDAAATEALDLLRKWVQHLDEREQAIATLLWVDGLTQEQAAEVLGLSRKTIGREVEELRRKAAALGALPEESGDG